MVTDRSIIILEEYDLDITLFFRSLVKYTLFLGKLRTLHFSWLTLIFILLKNCNYSFSFLFTIFRYRSDSPSIFSQSFAGRVLNELSPDGSLYDGTSPHHHVAKRGGSMGNGGVYSPGMVLLPKLFWPSVKKKYSSDREKLLKFKAKGREFAKILRSLEQWKVRTIFETESSFNLFLEVS